MYSFQLTKFRSCITFLSKYSFQLPVGNTVNHPIAIFLSPMPIKRAEEDSLTSIIASDHRERLRQWLWAKLSSKKKRNKFKAELKVEKQLDHEWNKIVMKETSDGIMLNPRAWKRAEEKFKHSRSKHSLRKHLYRITRTRDTRPLTDIGTHLYTYISLHAYQVTIACTSEYAYIVRLLHALLHFLRSEYELIVQNPHRHKHDATKTLHLLREIGMPRHVGPRSMKRMCAEPMPSRRALKCSHLSKAEKFVAPSVGTLGSYSVPVPLWPVVRKLKFEYHLSTQRPRIRRTRHMTHRASTEVRIASKLGSLSTCIADLTQDGHIRTANLLRSITQRLQEIAILQARPLSGNKVLRDTVQFLVQSLELMSNPSQSGPRRISITDGVTIGSAVAVGLLLFFLHYALLVLPHRDITKVQFDSHSIGTALALYGTRPNWHIDISGDKHAATHANRYLQSCLAIIKNPRPELHAFSRRNVDGANRLWAQTPPDKSTCKWCWQEFTTKSASIDFACSFCAIGANRCHIDEIVAVGHNENVGICPGCVTGSKWEYVVRSAVGGVGRRIIRELSQLRENGSITLVYVDGKTGFLRVHPDPQDLDRVIFCGDLFIPQRFVHVNLQWAREHIPQWDQLEQMYRDRATTITWTEYSVNLYQAAKLYFETTPNSRYSMTGGGNTVKCPWRFGKDKMYTYHLSNIGPLRDNGFMSWPSLLDIVGHGRERCRSLVTVLDHQAFDPSKGLLKQWVTDYCSCTSTFNKYMSMFSIGMTYKSPQTCWSVVRSKEESVQDHVLGRWSTNRLDMFDFIGIELLRDLKRSVEHMNQFVLARRDVPEKLERRIQNLRYKVADERRFVKPSKVYVAETNIDAEVHTRLPELVHGVEELQLLTAILNFAVFEEHPHIRAFGQYRAAGVVDGKELADVDFQQYRPRYMVTPHRDADGLIDVDMKVAGPFYIFKLNPDMTQSHRHPEHHRQTIHRSKRKRYLYDADQIYQKGEDHVLCCDSLVGYGCVARKACGLSSNFKYDGAHLLLPPGTIYSMFGIGAWGGVSHSIHVKGAVAKDTIMRFGALTRLMYNVCARPMLKLITINKEQP